MNSIEPSVIIAILLFIILIIIVCWLIISLVYDLIGTHQRTSLFRQINSRFNDEVPFDESDLRFLYNSCASWFTSFASFVEEYLLYLQWNSFKDLRDPQKVNTFLKELIEKEQALLPYAEIGERERSSMLRIESAVSDDKAKSVIKDNLEDLSAAIRKKEKDLVRAKRNNRWSISLAIIGTLIGTISFFSGSKISKGSMQQIKEVITTAIDERLETSMSADTLIIQQTPISSNESVSDKM